MIPTPDIELRTPEDREYVRDPDARPAVEPDLASYPEQPEWRAAALEELQ